MIDDPLGLFLPPVQQWFRDYFGEPTAAQRLGWPAIATGQNTLILAPTGSGKTLAAFLACLDRCWRQESLSRGVRVLYISPLKALNNDIHRNLQVPLAGIEAYAQAAGSCLPHIDTGVRTGDTPAAERQRQLRRPPHVLITTPESLHLLLTSRARETLRGVGHVIVDEIHALLTNKRGVFLSLLLERLEELVAHSFVRIGLSATQRPLEEVAHFLGGRSVREDGSYAARPVHIVNAGLRKNLDLKVLSPVEHFGPLPEKSIWPSIYRLLAAQVREHRSTIIFANNRRTVERITAHLNEDFAEAAVALDDMDEDRGLPQAEMSQSPGTVRSAEPAPAVAGKGDAERPYPSARAHHGSIALDVRQQTEQALKDGRLAAVVATGSLELGIDMGAVDLVCQVESPGTVARGLQRVGRAGHLVGGMSKGRLIPKTLADLLEEAVLARKMMEGAVEEIVVPTNCLDVLAQQVIAMVAVDGWDVRNLYALVCRAYPFRNLTAQAFESVLQMISGRYQFSEQAQEADDPRPRSRRQTMAALQPRISWDRVHNRLVALPGSQQLALVSGGTIPDTGQYAAYTTTGVRLGELDEEFIYERRVGDTFALGTNVWRLESVETDRVLVSPAEGAPALMPFWRGERTGRSYDLGKAIGAFLRELVERLEEKNGPSWLEQEYFLDPRAARDLWSYVRRQWHHSAAVPTDRTLIIEASRDPLGDWQVILLCPLGSRINLALRLALEARLSTRLGYRPQCLHHDEGVLIRMADMEEPILDLFAGVTAESIEELILGQLADSALFALRFRQNAARALLLPRLQPGKRAPLWLQRLRGQDLLQVARRHPDFPIVAETFRECFHDHLDIEHVQVLLRDLQEGRVELVARRAETPSPFSSSLLFAFTTAFMYDQGTTPSETTSALDRELLGQLLGMSGQQPLLDSQAVEQVDRRLRGVGMPPRSPAEMAERLRRLGDIADSELEGPMAGLLKELASQGQAVRFTVPGGNPAERWVLAEEHGLYEKAFAGRGGAESQRAAEAILSRYLETHALVGLAEVVERYAFDRQWVQSKLEAWTQGGRAMVLPSQEPGPLQWSAPENLEQVQRRTLTLLRREVLTCPAAQFADFLLHWQKVHPATRVGASQGVREVLGILEGVSLPAPLWQQQVLPARVPQYQSRWLDEILAGGEWQWICQGDSRDECQVAFWQHPHARRRPSPADDGNLDALAERVLATLRSRGASFVIDLVQTLGENGSAVRTALWRLARAGRVSNDSFEGIRREEQALSTGPDPSVARTATENGPGGLDRSVDLHRERYGSSRLAPRGRTRLRPAMRPEGRWFLIDRGPAEAEAQAIFCTHLLLNRYGVVARELAMLDPAMPAWRVLYEVLSRMEMAGSVRRGYFVEGLSGAQFALPEAAQQLRQAAVPAPSRAPLVLLHSQDPANLYGSGGPFEIPHEEGVRALLRRSGNWLVLRAGRPVLLIEQNGRRLTALSDSSDEELAQAIALLPYTLGPRGQSREPRHRLTVEEWNGAAVVGTRGRELLEAVGFLRDYHGMTLYAAWNQSNARR